MSNCCSQCTAQIPLEKLEGSNVLGIRMCETCREEAARTTIPLEVRTQIDEAIPLEKQYNWWVSGHDLLGGWSPGDLWQDGGQAGQQTVAEFIESAKSGDMS